MEKEDAITSLKSKLEEFQSLTLELGELAKQAIKEDLNEEDTELVMGIL